MKRLAVLIFVFFSIPVYAASGTVTIDPSLESAVEPTSDGYLIPVSNSSGTLTVEDGPYSVTGSFSGSSGYTIQVSFYKDSGRATIFYRGCSITLSPPDTFIVRDMYQVTGRGDPFACSSLSTTMLDFISFSNLEFETKSKSAIDASPETVNSEWNYFYSHPEGFWSCGFASATAALGIAGGAILTAYVVYTPVVPIAVKKYSVVTFVTGTVMAASWAGSYCT